MKRLGVLAVLLYAIALAAVPARAFTLLDRIPGRRRLIPTIGLLISFRSGGCH